MSWLVDEDSLGTALSLLADAGVPQAGRDVLADHARRFSAAVGAAGLVPGFVQRATAPAYDPDQVSGAWQAAHPELVGQNCRLTAFTLFSSFVTVSGTPEQVRAGSAYDNLAFDHVSLEGDPAAAPTPEDRRRFDALYTSVATTGSLDAREHAAAWAAGLAERGVALADQPGLRLISVVLHSDIEGPELFVGHTGLLMPAGDQLHFIEKLAFDEPYRLTTFSSRAELNEALMRAYDVDDTGTLAPAVILENTAVMEGYARVR